MAPAPAPARPRGDAVDRPELRAAGLALLVFAASSLALLAQAARLQRGLHAR